LDARALFFHLGVRSLGGHALRTVGAGRSLAPADFHAPFTLTCLVSRNEGAPMRLPHRKHPDIGEKRMSFKAVTGALLVALPFNVNADAASMSGAAKAGSPPAGAAAPSIASPIPPANPPAGGAAPTTSAPAQSSPSGGSGMGNNFGTSGTLGNTNGQPAAK
jgi:hypothetical protein